MINAKPEWVIYKNDQRIGQAVTWHRALDVLCKQEDIRFFMVERFNDLVFVRNNFQFKNCDRYKIVKER